MKRCLKYLVAGITAFYSLFAPAHAQNHKQEERELRELLLQLPSNVYGGLYWNQANIEQITTDTLATRVSGAADTILVRRFSLSQPSLPGIYPDSTAMHIKYTDKQPLWHPDEQDVLELTLIHMRRAHHDTTATPTRPKRGVLAFLPKISKFSKKPAYLSAQNAAPDTTITEWYKSAGLNGWYPGQFPLDPRDEGRITIRMGGEIFKTQSSPQRYYQIRHSLIELLTTPPDTLQSGINQE